MLWNIHIWRCRDKSMSPTFFVHEKWDLENFEWQYILQGSKEKNVFVSYIIILFGLKLNEKFEFSTMCVLDLVVYCILRITTCLTNSLIRTWTNSHQWTFMQNDTCVRRIYSLFLFTLLLILLWNSFPYTLSLKFQFLFWR